MPPPTATTCTHADVYAHFDADGLITFFFGFCLRLRLQAGHETSASMLTWSLFELSQNEKTLETMLDEGKAVFAGG